MHRDQNIIFTRSRNWLYSKWLNIFPFYFGYAVYASLLFMFVLRLNVTTPLSQVRHSFKWFSYILSFRTFHLLFRNSYALQKLAIWMTLQKSQGKYWADVGFSWSQCKHRCTFLKFVLTASIFKWIKKQFPRRKYIQKRIVLIWQNVIHELWVPGYGLRNTNRKAGVEIQKYGSNPCVQIHINLKTLIR